MGRALLWLALVATMAFVAACGSEQAQKVPDAKIAAALSLQQTDSGYRVGANPFCRIGELLNDADETSGLTKAEQRVAITSRSGNIGVVVKTPFAPTCKDEVAAALNKLDRGKKKG
jgi:predicted small lipoprotein YifL